MNKKTHKRFTKRERLDITRHFEGVRNSVMEKIKKRMELLASDEELKKEMLKEIKGELCLNAGSAGDAAAGKKTASL